LKEEILKVHRP